MKQATPIWAKDLSQEKNILLSFTAEVDYTGGQAALTVAADALFRLLVNGEFVSHGPQRCGRSWHREETIDLTDILCKGKNTVELWVQSYQVISFEYVLQPPFVMAELELDGKVVASTGSNFVCRRNLSKEQVVERYSYQRPFIEVWNLPYRFSEPLETVKVENVRVLPRTAPKARFDFVSPEKTIAYGKMAIKEMLDVDVRAEIAGEPTFSYEKAEIPVLYRNISASLESVEITHVDEPYADRTLAANEFFTVKLAHEDSGFVEATLTCEEESTVYFIYDELLTDDDVRPIQHSRSWCNLIPVTMQKGTYHFIALEPRAVHYLKAYCAKGCVKVENLGLKEYVNGLARTASFESSDPVLNRIFHAAVNTFEQNAVDLFMDCPSRERAGWLCDSFFTGRTEKDLTGQSAVEKGFLENFFLADLFVKHPKGMFPMCYPSDEIKGQFIPNWAMFLVIELEEYVKRSGDTAMIDMAKERLYALEDYFCTLLNKDGLLEKLVGWVFVEWSQANHWVQDVNFPSNMMYYAMLKAMGRMYNDPALDQKAEKIKATIRRLSFNGTFFRDHMVYDENGVLTTPEDITEVCQYYAFFTGVADKETYPELLQIIAEDFGAGHKCLQTRPGVYPANAFIGNYLRMEILSQNGLRKQIMGEIKEYFDYMAQRTGTLWENDSPSASCNHGFSSHAVRLIFRDCLGIQNIDEDTKQVYLNYDFTSPEDASAYMPLRSGALKVTVKNGKRTVEVEGEYTLV